MCTLEHLRRHLSTWVDAVEHLCDRVLVCCWGNLTFKVFLSEGSWRRGVDLFRKYLSSEVLRRGDVVLLVAEHPTILITKLRRVLGPEVIQYLELVPVPLTRRLETTLTWLEEALCRTLAREYFDLITQHRPGTPAPETCPRCGGTLLLCRARRVYSVKLSAWSLEEFLRCSTCGLRIHRLTAVGGQ